MKKKKYSKIKAGDFVVAEHQRGLVIRIYHNKIEEFYQQKHVVVYFDAEDSGVQHSAFDPTESVVVLKGLKRKEAMQKLLREFRKRVYDLREELHMLNLIHELTSDQNERSK